nr:MetaGeneMark_Unknown Function [uncultured bacterium]
MDRADIEAVIKKVPKLTSFGVGIFKNPNPRPEHPKFIEDQQELLDSAET